MDQWMTCTDALDLNLNPKPNSNRGVATGCILVFIPPKSAQVNFLWGKNDVRTAIQQFYTPKTFIAQKQISGYAPETLTLTLTKP